jgi:hypothetical protein
MSAAHDAHADASAGHHAHDHFDNAPATELGADETPTAPWVPYLGLALFFSAGVACLVYSGDDKPAADKPVAAEAAPAVPAVQPPPQLRALPAPQPGMPMQPGQPGGAATNNALKQLTPEQARDIQQRIEAMKAMQQNGAQPTPPQPGAAPRPAVPPQPPPRPSPDH